MIRYIFIFSAIFGCNLRSQETVIYVDETPEIDSTSYYSIRYDKDGNIIGEYKSDEYLELEAEIDKVFTNHHLYSIKDLSGDGVAISHKTNLQGMIVGSKDKNDTVMILRSESESIQRPIDESGKFEFSDLPIDTYHLFVSNTTSQLTFIDKIDLKNGLNYKLTLEKKEE
ncbi:hypothetical protein [Tunicatimonas pelagia]|uniref:hypothetical protein n=1 Tax=Tunicatimonas pelagia TaxID=931531 RepID=UPI0026652619|nr:hypothetical protein [Tunicatimonas pelagia]WKN45120.1 hypothetical protein P0M28_09110 [Tunicatimonas pelagia]